MRPSSSNRADGALSPEFDPERNPYANGLRGPGKSKRAWDAGYIKSFQVAQIGDPVEFELTGGVMAGGVVKILQRQEGEVRFVSGTLTTPEQGTFFFLTPPIGGKAGKAVGVIEFPGSQTAYRIEPTGANGDPELWQRQLNEVVCQSMPERDETRMAAAATNEAQNMPPLNPDLMPQYFPNHNTNLNGAKIISLQSKPGAPGVILLDFFGGYTPHWGGVNFTPAPASNDAIRDIWRRIAEDYEPFNINVTTDLKVYLAAPAGSRQRCCYTTTPVTAAGVAYIGSWNWGSDAVCWSVYYDGKGGGEVGAHEVGHTLNLGHQGQDIPNGSGGFDHNEYYDGHGSGETGWCPIMGAGYYQPVTTWAKGEFQYAYNTNDALNTIITANNNVSYRTDDTGNSLATSRYLEAYSNNAIFAEGIIERTADTDAFQFTTTGGAVSLTAKQVGFWADVGLMATLANSSDVVIASNNPASTLSASIATTLAAGTYTFRVTGAGRNNPLTDGFSSYASLGYYSVTGSVAGVRLPDRFTVAENSPNGTVVGTINSTNLGVNPLIYVITSGNTGGAFAVNNNGALTVANAAVLDYEALGQNTQFPVQFELLVNITNTVNGSLTETKRRVVVQVLDANEGPSATGFTNTVIVGTQPGTAIGTVMGTDPDAFTTLNYSIVSGNTNNVFAIGLENGIISVAGNLTSSLAGTYNLLVQVTDGTSNATANVRITVIGNNSPFQPGSISYAVYDGIGNGELVPNLTNNARFPTDPTWEQQRPTLEGDTDRADGYGSVMRGYLIPPVSGVYTFFIATDDNGELWISTSTNPAAMTLAASITGGGNWASVRQWNKFASQTSTPRSLNAGQAYYIEARQKEGGGGDNLAVAWKGPATTNMTNVIPALYLAPRFINYVPHATGFTVNVRRDAMFGARVGRVTATDVNSNDTHTFAITAGNGENIFSMDAAGYVVVTNTAALTATVTSSFLLTVQVTDSGSPALSATTTVTLNLVAPGAIVATQIQREMFTNISGTAVSDLTSNAKYPGKPDTLAALTDFGAPIDISNDFGSRVRAHLVPSVTGDYRFFIASDDNSQLKFSYTTNPASATVIASVGDWTSQNQWTKYASQTSALITNLQAGQSYYIEALHKEGGGGDNLSVGWLVPGSGVTNVIPGANLVPVDINGAPQINAQSFSILQTAPNGSFVGTVIGSDSPLDALTFQLVAGNTNNTFTIDPATGVLRVQDSSLVNSGALTSFPLSVAVQDSGYGGKYPLRAATNTVTVNVTGTNVPFVWSGDGLTSQWSDTANWAGGAPYPGVRLVFGRPVRQTNVNNFLASANWVQFTTGGFNITGNPITLQTGLTNTGANTWGVPTTLGAAQTWVHNGGGELNLSGGITNGGFTHTLVANDDLRISAPISGAGGLNKSGTARLLLQGTNLFTGATVISAASGTTSALEVVGTGDLIMGSSDLTMNGRMDLSSHNATIGALTGNGLIFANYGTRTLTLGANNHSGTFSGSIQDSTWGTGVKLGLIKNGSGSQTFSNTNNYSGDFAINAGTVIVSASSPTAGSGSALGSNVPSRTITIGPATLVLSINNVFGGTGVSPAARPKLVLHGTLTSTRYNVLPDLTLNGGVLRNSNSTDPSNYDGFQFVGSITVGGTSAATFDTTTGRGNHLLGGGTTVFNVADATANANTDLAVNTVLRDGSTDYPGAAALQKTGAGTMTLSVNNAYTGGTTITDGALQIGNGGVTGSVNGAITNNGALIFNRSGVLTHSGVILGTGSVTKTGGGNVTLSAVNSYSGATTVNQGTLLLGAGGSIANTSAITIAPGATLDVTAKGTWLVGASQTLQGSGTVAGATTISGTVLPGSSPGTLSFTGDITLAGTAVMEISKSGATLTNDLLSTTGTITYGGLLIVTNLGPDAFVAGDSFRLFNAANYGGNLAMTNLPALDAGLLWSWTPANGTLSVVPAINASPTNLIASVSGNQLTLSWPSDRTGWTLQTQTNSLVLGLSPYGWFPVAGSDTTNSVTITLDPEQPAIFFRMIYP